MINRYYSVLNYYAPTESTNERGNDVKSRLTPVVFDGVINQASSKERSMAGQTGLQIDAKLYYPTSVNIPAGSIVYDGTNRYRIVSEPKNTMNRDHHYMVYLQRITKENITLGT